MIAAANSAFPIRPLAISFGVAVAVFVLQLAMMAPPGGVAVIVIAPLFWLASVVYAMARSLRWGWISLLGAPFALFGLFVLANFLAGVSRETEAVKANPIANEIRQGSGGQWDRRVAISDDVMPRGEELAAVDARLERFEFLKLEDSQRSNWLGENVEPGTRVYISRIYSEFPCSVLFVVVADFNASSRLTEAEGYVPPGACL